RARHRGPRAGALPVIAPQPLPGPPPPFAAGTHLAPGPRHRHSGDASSLPAGDRAAPGPRHRLPPPTRTSKAPNPVPPVSAAPPFDLVVAIANLVVLTALGVPKRRS